MNGVLGSFMDNSPTNQLADTPTRRQTNSPTIKLAKKTNSPKLREGHSHWGTPPP